MVHPALKRKRCFEEDVGLATPKKASYIAPDATFISAYPMTQNTVPDTSVSSPAATPAFLSHLPSTPSNDPFPIIRVLFDLMTPLEISRILKKRTACLLSCWPPAFPSQPPATPPPLTSFPSFIDRPESKELTTSTVHAFLTFFRADDFRTDGSGVTLQDLHTHVKALHTLFSFVSSRELKDIVQARLNSSPSKESERWVAVQGLLDVMRLACEDEGGDAPRDFSALHALVKEDIENQRKLRVEVGVCTTDGKDATQDRNIEPQTSACRNQEESSSHDDHSQKRAGTTQTTLSNDQASQPGVSLLKKDQAIMTTTSCELNPNELASLSVSTLSGRQSPSPSSSSAKTPQQERCRQGSSSGSSGLMVTPLLNIEQNEEEGWKSDLDAEGDTDTDMDTDMDMSEDSEMNENEHPPQSCTDCTVVVTDGGIPGLFVSKEKEVVSITTNNAQVESRKAMPLAVQVESSTETQYPLSDAQRSPSQLFEQSPSTPTQTRFSFAPSLSRPGGQVQPWHTNSVQTEGLHSPPLMFQSPPPHSPPLEPPLSSEIDTSAATATGDLDAFGRGKNLHSTKPTLLQESVPGLVQTNHSPGMSPMPPTAPRGLRAATSLPSVRPPPTFVRAQQPVPSISDLFNTLTSPIKSKDSSSVVKIDSNNVQSPVRESTSLNVQKELVSVRDAAYVFKNVFGGPNGVGLTSGNPLSLNRASSGTVHEYNVIHNRQDIRMLRHEAVTRSTLSTVSTSPTYNPPRSSIIARGVPPTGPRGTAVFRSTSMTSTIYPTSDNNTFFPQRNPLLEGIELSSQPPKPSDICTLDQSHGFQRARSVSLGPIVYNLQEKNYARDEPRSRSSSVSSGDSRRSISRSPSRSTMIRKRHRRPRSRSPSSSRSSRGRHCSSCRRRRSSHSSSRTSRSPAPSMPGSYRRNTYSHSRPSPMSVTRHRHWSPSMGRKKKKASHSSYQVKKSKKQVRHDHWSPGRTTGRRNSCEADSGFNERTSDILASPMTHPPVRRWR